MISHGVYFPRGRSLWGTRRNFNGEIVYTRRRTVIHAICPLFTEHFLLGNILCFFELVFPWGEIFTGGWREFLAWLKKDPPLNETRPTLPEQREVLRQPLSGFVK